MESDHDKNKRILEFFLKVPEFYCLEDYGNCTMIYNINYNCKNNLKNPVNNNNSIPVYYFIDKKEYQQIKELYSLKKIFLFIRINYGKENINILINRSEQLSEKEVLDKINHIKYMKTPIRFHLKILDFPLSNYYLKEIVSTDNLIDKAYTLEKVSNSGLNSNQTVDNKKLNDNINTGIIIKAMDKSSNSNNNKNTLNNNIIQGNSNIKIQNQNNYKNNTNNIKNKNTNNNKNYINNIKNNNNENINHLKNNYNNNGFSNSNINSFNFQNNNNLTPNQINCLINMNSKNNMNLNNMNQINNFNMIPMNNMNFMNNFFMNNMNNSNNNSNDINNVKDDNNKNILIKEIIGSGYEKLFPIKGLKNVGLTCYMNSTLQCLLHIPELNQYFFKKYNEQKEILNKINKNCETKGRLSKEYWKVVNGVLSGIDGQFYYSYNNPFSPIDFNNALSSMNTQFSKYESNDAKDLLLYLFQTMHEELNYFGDEKLKNVPKCNQLIEKESYNFFVKVNFSLNLSIFSYLFYGIIKSSTKCLACNKILYNFQYFQFLSFPTYKYDEKTFNIYKGFQEFIKEENMSGDNKCYCQHCKGLKDAKVSSIIFYPPPYLIINFDYGKGKKYKPKVINFGEIIDLQGFTDDKCQKKTYELISVSTHIGSSGNSGHYITYCKDNDNEWHLFNDSNHRFCSFKEVNSYSPYLLIYRREEGEF